MVRGRPVEYSKKDLLIRLEGYKSTIVRICTPAAKALDRTYLSSV